MINKPIDQITESDLQSLIDNAVAERKTIEYKQILQANSDSEKKEFLADVSSFANASGGDLIFGISTEKDVPKSLAGIDITNADITKLDSMIRDGIEPRLPSIAIQLIMLSNSKNVLIIRVAKSWLSPHRVTYKGHDKFYSRSTNGKYSLDVSELRIAFTLSEALTEKIRRFREERISKINADETPVPFEGKAKIILHLIPLISFNPAQRYEIEKIATGPIRMPPIYNNGWDQRYNLDGIITYSGNGKEKSHTYTQLYRNGIIEAVEGFLLSSSEDKKPFIPSIAYEEELIDSLNMYLKVLQHIKVELPILVFLTLLNVKNYYMYVDKFKYPFIKHHAIDRDILLLPEAIIENYNDSADKVLKPCFDAIWNACGFPESFNYDKNGKWKKS